MTYTYSEENYLKTIYHLQAQLGKVATTAVARSLQTSAASVTDMMKKLHTKGLLHYKPYYGFTLSAEGKKTALHVVRRHRLWEAFLADTLDFQINEVHEIAEELEHISNKKLIDKLDAFLGFPQFDPHGDPIPNNRGKMQQPEWRPLTEIVKPSSVIIKSIINQSPIFLSELALRKIAVGTVLQVLSISKIDGSLTVRISRKETLITQQIATSLLVQLKK